MTDEEVKNALENKDEYIESNEISNAVDELMQKYGKLKEAVGKIKAHLDSRRTAFTLKETYEEGRNVGLAIALETIDVYTEGLI